jgi:hypothetical protein
MRYPAFPSTTAKPLLGNKLTGPTLDLVFGIIKAVFVLRDHCVHKDYLHSKFYELTFELVMRLYEENITHTRYTQALSRDTTKSVLESNPFDINLEAWLDAYPSQSRQGKYAHPDYQDTYDLLTQYRQHGSDLPPEEFIIHLYVNNCMHILHSIQKKIEHFCPETWKKIQEKIPGKTIPYPSIKRLSQDGYTHSVLLANSIFTQGLHANKYSIWTPKRSFETLCDILYEHGPFICGPLKNNIVSINQESDSSKKLQPDQLGDDIPMRPPYPYHIVYQALSTNPTTSLPDSTESKHQSTDLVCLINPYLPKKAIILTYHDFCKSIDPLPFYPFPGTAYTLHLDSEEANQSDCDEERKQDTMRP